MKDRESTITDCITLQSSSTTLAFPTGDRDFTLAESTLPPPISAPAAC